MNKTTFNTLDQEELVRVSGQMTSLIDSEASIKSASSDSITREMLRDFKPDKDHFLLHVVALGDEEHYGFNRNGDSWPKEACVKYHDTFVTHGCFYREHKNTDPDKYGIGSIKASSYNESMGRIELIVHGNKKKAEDVYELAKSGSTVSVSMSAHVPYDVSSITGKECKTPREYDDYCKYRMTQWIPEHEKFAFVRNPIAKWFDISHVANPADRIAHHLEIHIKAASYSNGVICGADLADLSGIKTPAKFLVTGVTDIYKASYLNKLAAIETMLNDQSFYKSASNDRHYVEHVASKAFYDQLSDEELDAMKKCEPSSLFRKLAKAKVLLPLESFAAYAKGISVKEASESEVVKKAKELLPDMFNNVKESCDCGSLENVFDMGSSFMESHGDDTVDKFMESIKGKFGIGADTVRSRVIKITIMSDATPTIKLTGNTKKLASVNPTNTVESEAKSILEVYTMYKLSALRDMVRLHGGEVTDAEFMLTAYQNR